ncbi:type II toxin-antitoxin system ParD family antitoxin [Paraburkholderia dilworthii]|uniref:type II toxin-antitoxin system ParD family antitoxin n=1 Tax=Paraburkholderia dilworthii TaxID=948106 RepID=UPI001378CB1C|nr:type II toxin-antitoxin system ParD family antitoxin [Paraburkholderia dilworthii]
MPSKHAFSVCSAEQLASLIPAEIVKGRYCTASQIVCTGLRLLEEDIARRAMPDSSNGVARALHVEGIDGRRQA